MALNILIIDENRLLCSMLSGVLKADGHAVSCIIHAPRGFEAVRTAKPDLIILEVGKPENVGVELINRLERSPETRHIPVIVVSAYQELQYEILKVFDFLPRPIDIDRLRQDIGVIAAGGKGRPSPSTSLSDTECRLFHDFLALHSGLHFEKRNMKILERGLLNRMSALQMPSYRAYYDYLIRHYEDRQELKKLLQFLTVGETFFFRYRSHFDALLHGMLQEIKARKNSRKLHIWSAGCSTGEEPYSIAIAVMEALPDWRRWDIRIFATDINNSSLIRAREGIYGRRAVRMLPEEFAERYFDRIGEQLSVKAEVRGLVEFSYLNLQSEFLGGYSPYDIIFCRNVMIYFDTATTRKIVHKLAGCLVPSGYLFLGHAETLSNVSSEFERVSRFNGFYYRKRREPDTIRKEFRHHPSPPQAEPAPIPAADTLLEQHVSDVRHPDELFREAMVLFEAEDFQAASALLSEVLSLDPQHTQALIAFGFILGNNGHFEEALDLCGKALELDDLLADSYFLRGLIFDMNGQTEEAAPEYRKAILLDPNMVMPRYYLGKLCCRSGKEKEGMRELKNSLKKLEKSNGVIPYSGGLSREVFIDLIRKEMTDPEGLMRENHGA